MERSTILKPTGCDLTRLPLGSLEAFVLSQLDGHLTLEEIAAVCSLELAETATIARRLVELGAACHGQNQRPHRERRAPRATIRAAIEEDARAGSDPRSEGCSGRPGERSPLAEAPPLQTAAARKPTSAAVGKNPQKRPSSRKSLRAQRASSRRPSAPKPASAAQRAEPSHDRLQKLRAAAREIEVQARVEPLLRAADEALKTNDVISAANNLRLALEHREDPFVRLRLEEVDRLAKAVRHERSLALGRAAESEGRWAEAAAHLSRAHETKPTSEIADRAAHALLRGGGDLERAAALAEQAVSLAPKSARYRATLAEICLAAGMLARAATHASAALELAPKDPRARDLADAVARAKKSPP